MLNAKGSIKVLPFGGKILTKPSSSASNLFIMNTSDNMPASTISTTSTPVVMTSKLQESVVENKPPVVNSAMSDTIESDTIESTEVSDNLNDGKENVTPAKAQRKSSVLADILMASGVTASDSEGYVDDIETQITQLTEIPKGAKQDEVTTPLINVAVDSVDVVKDGNTEPMENDNRMYSVNDVNEQDVGVHIASKYNLFIFWVKIPSVTLLESNTLLCKFIPAVVCNIV